MPSTGTRSPTEDRVPPLDRQTSTRHIVLLVLTLLLSGRSMTLAFIARAGGPAPGDPPAAWLMPLIGDAVIGMSALVVALLLWRRAGLLGWTIAVAWNVVAIWDALSAYLIQVSVPWPSFFMIETFGSSMFFAASFIHAMCLYLLFQPSVRQDFFSMTDECQHDFSTSTQP